MSLLDLKANILAVVLAGGKVVFPYKAGAADWIVPAEVYKVEGGFYRHGPDWQHHATAEEAVDAFMGQVFSERNLAPSVREFLDGGP